MDDHRKFAAPPKFLCVLDRTLVICIAGIMALLSVASIIYTLTQEFEIFDFIGDGITILFEIPVIIGALFMRRFVLRVAKIALVISLIFLVVFGLLFTVFDTAAEATEKVDNSLDALFSTNTTGMFEREKSPEELFKSALIFGYITEIIFFIGFAIVYLQYFLINRLLKYVKYNGIDGQNRVSP